MDRLARAREGLRSPDLGTQAQANDELQRLIVLVESNPQFRSTALYQSQMAQLEGTENRINVGRQRYNDAATRYNRAAQSFPSNLVRPLFGLPPELPLLQPRGDVEAPPKR